MNKKYLEFLLNEIKESVIRQNDREYTAQLIYIMEVYIHNFMESETEDNAVQGFEEYK